MTNLALRCLCLAALLAASLASIGCAGTRDNAQADAAAARPAQGATMRTPF